jgi:PAS domain S-box-containing protein
VDRPDRPDPLAVRDVAGEQLGADATLQQERDLRAAAIQALQDGFFRMDVGGRVVEANDRFCEIVGRSRDETIGVRPPHPWWGPGPEETRRLTELLDAPVTADGSSLELEAPVVRPDGSTVMTICTASALSLEDGSRVGAVGTLKDISDQHLRLQRQERLAALSGELAGADSVAELAQAVASHGVAAAEADAGSVALLSSDRRELHIMSTANVPREDLPAILGTVPVSAPVPGAEAARTGVPVYATKADARFSPRGFRTMLRMGRARSIVAQPLRAGETVIGTLTFGYVRDHDFDPDQREHLRSITDVAARALERTILAESTRRSEARTRALQRLTSRMADATSQGDIFAAVLELGLELTGASSAGIGIVTDPDRRMRLHRLDAIGGAGADEAAPVDLDEDVPIARAVREGVARYDLDPSSFPALGEPAVPDGAPPGAWAAIPLISEGRPIGVLAIGFATPQAFDDDQRGLLEAVAAQVTLSLERVRLLEEERRNAARASTLQHVAATLGGATTLTDVAQVVVEVAVPTMGAREGGLGIVGDGRTEVRILRDSGDTPPRTADRLAWPLRRGIPEGDAILDAKPVHLGSPEAIHAVYPRSGVEPTSGAVRALCALPLAVAGREPLGVLTLIFSEEQRFGNEQVGDLAAVASMVAQAVERGRLYGQEHQVALTLQRSLLPTPGAGPSWLAVATRYVPGTATLEVGGDWFDVVERTDGSVGLAVGDVVGHGVEAAAAMGQLRSALRAFAMLGRGPGATLEHLDTFAAHTRGAELATVAYAELDPGIREFRYACAGHPPPIMLHGHTAEVLDGGRSLLLAALPEPADRGEAAVGMQPGDVMVMYTDGLVEQRGTTIDDRVEHLCRTVESLAGASVDAIADGVLSEMLPLDGTDDDVALLCVRLLPDHARSWRHTFPADASELAATRSMVREWLRSMEVPAPVVDQMSLAVHEACANAIRHAYVDAGEDRGAVELELRLAGSDLTAWVIDEGEWREQVPAIGGGRGLPIMRDVMDEVSLDSGPGGTRLILRKRIGDPPPPA